LQVTPSRTWFEITIKLQFAIGEKLEFYFILKHGKDFNGKKTQNWKKKKIKIIIGLFNVTILKHKNQIENNFVLTNPNFIKLGLLLR